MTKFKGVIPGDRIGIIQGFGAVWAGEECLVHIVNPMWVHVERLSNGVRFKMEPWRLGYTFKVIERPEKCSECGGAPHLDQTCGYEPPNHKATVTAGMTNCPDHGQFDWGEMQIQECPVCCRIERDRFKNCLEYITKECDYEETVPTKRWLQQVAADALNPEIDHHD